MPDQESGYKSPNFIAFRIREADGQLLTVVAALDPDYHDCRFPWATWYQEDDDRVDPRVAAPTARTCRRATDP